MKSHAHDILFVFRNQPTDVNGGSNAFGLSLRRILNDRCRRTLVLLFSLNSSRTGPELDFTASGCTEEQAGNTNFYSMLILILDVQLFCLVLIP